MVSSHAGAVRPVQISPMDSADIPAVPIPSAEGCHLRISWGSGNSLVACPIDTEASGGASGAPQTISSIRW